MESNLRGGEAGPGSGRLKKRRLFLAAATTGAKGSAHGVVVQARTRRDTDPALVGFTATKKIGNAVKRNRARRRLREALRSASRNLSLQGLDVVLIAREATANREFATLVDDVSRALRKSGAITPGR